jgi:hypothetical protein
MNSWPMPLWQMRILQLVSQIFNCEENADEIERTKTRIISSGLGDGVPKNPYLLSRAEEREAAKKQLQLQSGLTVPRRYVAPSVSESCFANTSDQHGLERLQGWNWRGRRGIHSSIGDDLSLSKLVI